jgi:hypothetical protein
MTTVRIPANHTVTRKLGHWTTEREFEVRAHHGVALLDLRSPHIAEGDLHVHVELDHAVLKLLLPGSDVIDDWDLVRTGRGKVKDAEGPEVGPRRVVLTGRMHASEIRVNRGGIAIISAMLTKEYLQDVRRAHREGGYPTVDDPTRTA